MLLTWRATVFSLMNRSSAIARFVFPVATSVEHLHFARREAARDRDRGLVRTAFRRARAPARRRAAGTPSAPRRAPCRRRRRRRARGTRDRSGRGRGPIRRARPGSRQPLHAWRSMPSAPRASPSASCTAPAHCVSQRRDERRVHLRGNHRQLVRGSRAPRRRRPRRERSRRRRRARALATHGSCASSNTRRIAASAASSWS